MWRKWLLLRKRTSMKTFDPTTLPLTKYLFFTGKGGVGKTTSACATAVTLADTGKKVMLVSTDPASNLQDVFQTKLTNKPKTNVPPDNRRHVHFLFSSSHISVCHPYQPDGRPPGGCQWFSSPAPAHGRCPSRTGSAC